MVFSNLQFIFTFTGYPKTGRMHQIRVHLQWLGHPIVNDPIYNHATAWGEGGGKRGTEIDVKKVINFFTKVGSSIKSQKYQFNGVYDSPSPN